MLIELYRLEEPPEPLAIPPRPPGPHRSPPPPAPSPQPRRPCWLSLIVAFTCGAGLAWLVAL